MKEGEAMELDEPMGKLTDRMQIKREHGVTLLQSVLSNAGNLILCFRFILFNALWIILRVWIVTNLSSMRFSKLPTYCLLFT